MKQLILPSQTRFIRQAVISLVRTVKQEVPGVDQHELDVALSEALANAIIHGNAEDSAKKVTAQVDITSRRLIFMVTDEGPGFDHRHFTDPRKKENLLKRHGRGLFLIQAFMDEVQFNRSGNRIVMIKYINEVFTKNAKRQNQNFLAIA